MQGAPLLPPGQEAFHIVSHIKSFAPPTTTLGKPEGPVHPRLPDSERLPHAAQ